MQNILRIYELVDTNTHVIMQDTSIKHHLSLAMRFRHRTGNRYRQNWRVISTDEYGVFF